MALDFFTFTRDSEASTILQDGTLSNVAIDVPVINFRDGAFAGYYSQVEATNLLQRSEEFDNAYWSKATGTVSANVATAPDGTMTADKYIVNDGQSTNSPIIKTFNFTPNTQYTFSVFVKADEVISASIRINTTETGLIANFFNLVNKTATDNQIEELPNGWFRVWVSITTLATVTNGQVQLIRDANLRDGTSGIFIWGAQLETGSVATSYIKTVATTATRDEDVATITNVADKLGLTAGSCQITAIFPTDYPLIVNGLQATVTGIKTIRFEYTTTTIELYVDNVLADSATGTYDWSTLNEIQLGHYNGADQPNFELRDLIVRKA